MSTSIVYHTPSVVLLDTCVLLDLIQDVENQGLVSIIEDLVSNKHLVLLVPEQVKVEFERNADKVESANLDILRKRINAASQIADLSKNPDIFRDEVSHIRDVVAEQEKLRAKGIRDRLKILIDSAWIEPTQEADLINAAKRALDKRAPCHLNKNSVGDAVIFEVFNRISAIAVQYDYYFVTKNTKDFSASTGDTRKFHEDFNGTFNNIRLKYKISLVELIDQLKDMMSSAQAKEAERLLARESRLRESMLKLAVIQRHEEVGEKVSKCPSCHSSFTREIVGWGIVMYDPSPQWYYRCQNCGLRIPTGDYICD